MATLVLDDLSASQRAQLAAMPVSGHCEWRAPHGDGFAAYFVSLATQSIAPEPRLMHSTGFGPLVLPGAVA